MLTDFDKSDVFELEIEPKIESLVQACNKHHIPFFMTACIKNNQNESVYKTDMYASASNEIKLKTDYFPRLVNVMNGFATVPPLDDLEIDYD